MGGMTHHTFTFVIMFLYAVNAANYALNSDAARACYWVFALGITASTLFIGGE